MVEVIVREVSPDEDPLEVELVENAQRRELSDDEEADAFIRLMRGRKREMSEIAAIAGRSIAYVSKRVRVFEDAQLRDAVLRGQITASHAEELLVVDPSQRGDLIARLNSGDLSFKAFRGAIQALVNPPQDGPVLVADVGAESSGDDPSASVAAEWVEGEFEDDDEEGSSAAGFPLSDSQRSVVRAPKIERPSDLTRRVRELATILEDLRPYQLTPRDDRALERLWDILIRLARASREKNALPVIPSVVDAEALARRGRKR
jgi:ParB-like chromosome segregation protein Spo0J